MKKLICLIICCMLIVSTSAGVTAASTENAFSGIKAQFGPVSPVSAANSVVSTYILFQNVSEPVECTLRWYINDILCKEEFHFRLESGAVSSFDCSVHFDNDTPEKSTLWVEVIDNDGDGHAVFTQPLKTVSIEAIEDPDRDSYLIHVIRNQCVVIVYEKQENGEPGRVVNTFVCSPGLNNWTITGHYGAYDREIWLGLVGGVSGHYATLIHGNFLFHSVPYYGGDNSRLKPGEYNKLGEPASAGCIRLAVCDAKWLFDNCVYGTEVYLFDADSLPVVKPLAIEINPESPNAGWDPTDPAPENPTRAKSIPPKNSILLIPLRSDVYMIRIP